MSNSSKTNIGIVGVGHLGSFHVEQYQKLDDVNIVGFYDTNSAQSNQVKNKYNNNAYDSLEKLLAACNAVSIATPTTTHCKIAKQAMEMGCHVLIEKPITQNIKEAKELVSIAKKKKLIITKMVCQIYFCVQLMANLNYLKI